MAMNMTTTQRRVYDILVENIGDTVPYSAFERVISCKKGKQNLCQFIRQLRAMGLRIYNVRRTGYRLTPRNREMHKIIDDLETQCYAQDIQAALHNAMAKYADSVGFEPQIAIMGVAIGAILHQLPEYERKRFVRILLRNIDQAPEFSHVMRCSDKWQSTIRGLSASQFDASSAAGYFAVQQNSQNAIAAEPAEIEDDQGAGPPKPTA